jgi:hypothetical protein
MTDELEQFDEAEERDEDLELQDEAADEVKGGIFIKFGETVDFHFEK